MLRVVGFDSRFSGRFPTGYIMFSDRTRITYSSLLDSTTCRPGTQRDEWGLNPDWADQGVSEVHLRLARVYVDKHLVRPAVAIPQYRAEQAEQEKRETRAKSKANA